MTFMPWNDELELGIDLVDSQHRWLVDATNKLYDEINKAEPDRDAVGEILMGLVEYAINHFIMEEDMFQRYAYPQRAEHKQEHDAFNVKAHQLLEQHESGESVAVEVMDFLKNWLKHHIMEVDKAYVPFLQEKSMKDKNVA